MPPALGNCLLGGWHLLTHRPGLRQPPPWGVLNPHFQMGWVSLRAPNPLQSLLQCPQDSRSHLSSRQLSPHLLSDSPLRTGLQASVSGGASVPQRALCPPTPGNSPGPWLSCPHGPKQTCQHLSLQRLLNAPGPQASPGDHPVHCRAGVTPQSPLVPLWATLPPAPEADSQTLSEHIPSLLKTPHVHTAFRTNPSWDAWVT